MSARTQRAGQPGTKPVRTKLNPLRTAGLVAADGSFSIDYKDTALLRRFISDRGKIRSRRVTGLTPRQQRAVAVAIKNAREMALLPSPSAPRSGSTRINPSTPGRLSTTEEP